MTHKRKDERNVMEEGRYRNEHRGATLIEEEKLEEDVGSEKRKSNKITSHQERGKNPRKPNR